MRSILIFLEILLYNICSLKSEKVEINSKLYQIKLYSIDTIDFKNVYLYYLLIYKSISFN